MTRRRPLPRARARRRRSCPFECIRPDRRIYSVKAVISQIGSRHRQALSGKNRAHGPAQSKQDGSLGTHVEMDELKVCLTKSRKPIAGYICLARLLPSIVIRCLMGPILIAGLQIHPSPPTEVSRKRRFSSRDFFSSYALCKVPEQPMVGSVVTYPIYWSV